MRKMPDTLLAVSIEATCWERPSDQPPTMKNEIIEIGIVPVSLIEPKMGEPRSILVKPIKSKVSKFCTRITSLTQEQVDTGISFREACEILVKEYNSPNIPWVSWGDFDRKIFVWQCDDFKCPYVFGAGHWDISTTFAKMMGLEHDVGLAIALNLIGLEFEGIRHRGADEAKNTARIMISMFGKLRELMVKKDEKVISKEKSTEETKEQNEN
jgi:inhibitor of KinA sporulation pathway (predicted exonuclease)